MDSESLERWLTLRLRMARDCEPNETRALLTRAVATAFERQDSGGISDSELRDLASQTLSALYFEHLRKRRALNRLGKLELAWSSSLERGAYRRRSDVRWPTRDRRTIVGSYRVQHLGRCRFAAELWQPPDHGLVEFIVVPDIAVFEAIAAVSLYRASTHRKFRRVAELAELSPREDGTICFHLSSDTLLAAEYELILIQRNSLGCVREDHFRIAIADPHLPPLQPAMAMRRASRT